MEVLIVLGVLGIFLGVLYHWFGLWRQHRWNARQPVLSRSARITGKRIEVIGGSDTAAYTTYYATFETLDKQRQEFSLSGKEYGLLAEGDTGTLFSQGTRYKGFERQGA